MHVRVWGTRWSIATPAMADTLSEDDLIVLHTPDRKPPWRMLRPFPPT
jgi:hypothetical protein